MQSFTNFILEVMYPPNPDSQAGQLADAAATGRLESLLRPQHLLRSLWPRAELQLLPHDRPQCQRGPDHQAGLLRLQHPDDRSGGTIHAEESASSQPLSEGRKVRHAVLAHLLARPPLRRAAGRADSRLRFHARRRHRHDVPTSCSRRTSALEKCSRPSLHWSAARSTIPRASSWMRNGIHERDALEAFIFAMDSNFAPIVGQQVTLTATNAGAASARISLFLARAAADECEVIAFNSKTGEGYLYQRRRLLARQGEAAAVDGRTTPRARRLRHHDHVHLRPQGQWQAPGARPRPERGA